MSIEGVDDVVEIDDFTPGYDSPAQYSVAVVFAVEESEVVEKSEHAAK